MKDRLKIPRTLNSVVKKLTFYSHGSNFYHGRQQRNHTNEIPIQKRPCLHANEIGTRSISRLQYRHRVFYGLESWTGVLEWILGVNLGGKFWSGADWHNLLPTPSSWFRWHFQFYFKRKKLTKLMCSQHVVSTIDFYITSESHVMPSGHFREYILHLIGWLHDIVKPSHTIRINIVCFVYRS